MKFLRVMRERIIEQARTRYSSEVIEIDDNAKLSHAEGGTWVAAWVWVSDKEEQ